MEITLYSADEKSVFVDSKAIISCREESWGSEIEHKWALILWTPSGWSIISIRVIRVIRVFILDSLKMTEKAENGPCYKRYSRHLLFLEKLI